MIAIIADDLSGAAELAGIAAASGFTAEVQTEFDPSSEAEVVAVDTNTRLKTEIEAGRIALSVAQEIMAAQPEWIFKKTDSVLRGHVRVEIEAILEATGQAECLLVPANPSKQRVILDGNYYVDGVPLDQTLFASDPDFPRRSASVVELLGPTSCIRIPDVRDLSELTPPPSASTLAAGGADFFTGMLGCKAQRSPSLPSDPAKRVLLVSGSLAAWETGRAADMTSRGFRVHLVTDILSPTLWQTTDRLMIAVGPKGSPNPNKLLHDLISDAVFLAKDQRDLTIALEGGATAMAFIERMGWTRFEVLPYGHIGVGSLRPLNGPLLCIKPGSYPWPQSLF